MISNQSRAKNSISLYMRTRNKQTNIKNKNHADNAGWLTALKSKSHVDLLILFFSIRNSSDQQQSKAQSRPIRILLSNSRKKIETNACGEKYNEMYSTLHVTNRYIFMYRCAGVHIKHCIYEHDITLFCDRVQQTWCHCTEVLRLVKKKKKCLITLTRFFYVAFWCWYAAPRISHINNHEYKHINIFVCLFLWLYWYLAASLR